MYLFGLSKEQKELFLDLVIFSMTSDGVVDEREENVARQYCNEMQIEFRSTTNLSTYTDAIKKLKEISNLTELKKITLELVTLMYADDNFAEEEEELLDYVQKIFGFNSHLMGEIIFASRHLILSFRLIDNMIKN